MCQLQQLIPSFNYWFPVDSIDYENRTWLEPCFSIDLCKTSVKRNAYGAIQMFLYAHPEDEVMVGSSVVSTEMIGSKQIEMVLWVDQTVSSSSVKYLAPSRRKCLYLHETSLYYELHTPNLCQMDCRIRNAIQACQCIPFFYNLAHLQKCDASGMVCLSHKFKEWYNATCSCMELCDSIKYMQTAAKSMHFQQLNSQASIELLFPKRRFKRSILFSLSDLVVSFGGTAALFLGCSFLSGVEFIYFFLEYVVITFRTYLMYNQRKL